MEDLLRFIFHTLLVLGVAALAAFDVFLIGWALGWWL